MPEVPLVLSTRRVVASPVDGLEEVDDVAGPLVGSAVVGSGAVVVDELAALPVDPACSPVGAPR